MKVTTVPACRVGWQGQTLHYAVKAEGATEVLVPENDVEGVRVRIVDTRQVRNGIEAQVDVEVLDSKLY